MDIDKRVIKETRKRTIARYLSSKLIVWTFAILLTQYFFVNNIDEKLIPWLGTATLNIAIIIFAVITTLTIERLWLRKKWGLE